MTSRLNKSHRPPPTTNPGGGITHQESTGRKPTDPTTAALQRISNKAQQRLASAGGHIYISYYDIQFDIDIVLRWLNGYMHTMATGEASASSSSAGPLQETGAILGNLGRALQGIQSK